jgi:catechol 2,3-dioxygenase-like lactoylglutathione lyase family enzyme
MTSPTLLTLHHSAFTHPVGEEDRAREFYVGVLGLSEVPKPETMDRSKGCWFRTGGIEIHAIPDADFHPNKLGHPAILVDDLDALANHLAEKGVPVEPDGRFPGHRRFHTYDYFGNQLEFLQADQADDSERR